MSTIRVPIPGCSWEPGLGIQINDFIEMRSGLALAYPHRSGISNDVSRFYYADPVVHVLPTERTDPVLVWAVVQHGGVSKYQEQC